MYNFFQPSSSTKCDLGTCGLAMIWSVTVASAADIRARQVYYNVPYEDMHAPAVGPAHPFNKDGLAAGMRNHRAGHVEVSIAMPNLSCI